MGNERVRVAREVIDATVGDEGRGVFGGLENDESVDRSPAFCVTDEGYLDRLLCVSLVGPQMTVRRTFWDTIRLQGDSSAIALHFYSELFYALIALIP